MSKHERSWPLALGAVVLGIAAGSLFLGVPWPKVPLPGLTSLGQDRGVPTVEPRDGLRGPVAPPPRPRPPPSYRPPMVLSNSGTYKALEALRSPDASQRAAGAGTLSLSAEPERVLPALIGALEGDDDEFVRLVAAQSIGRLGAEEGLAPLMRAAADDPSAWVRGMAVEAHDSLMARVPVVRDGGG